MLLIEYIYQVYRTMLIDFAAQHNTAAFIISCLCLVATVIVLNVHHRTTDVPPCWKLMILRLRSRWVLNHVTPMAPDDPQDASNEEGYTANDSSKAAQPRSTVVKPVDWPMVARLLDLIFFVCFTTITLAITVLNATYFLAYVY